MSEILGKVFGFLGGGIGNKIVDTVAGQFPEKLSEAEKERLKNVIIEATRKHEFEMLQLVQEEQIMITERVKELEGSAEEIVQHGFAGKIIFFLRGIQRPIWSFAVMWLDLMVFSGKWKIQLQYGVEGRAIACPMPKDTGSILADFVNGANSPEQIWLMFWILNFAVLGFLFGDVFISLVPKITGLFRRRK